MKKINFLLFTFCMAIFSFAGLQQIKAQEPCPTGVDIHVANDISGSIDSREFQQSKDFVSLLGANFGTAYGTANDKTRVSISNWSAGSFNFEEYDFPTAGTNYATSISDILSYTTSARPFQGYTDLFTALLRANEWVNQNPVTGRTVPKVIVILTDTYCSQVSNNISSLATQIKNQGINIVLLAIDEAATCTNISGTQIASPGAYFNATDYQTLFNQAIQYINDIRDASCGNPTNFYYDLTINLYNFTRADCDTSPTSAVDYNITNQSFAENFNGNLFVSFYNGDPTDANTQFLFTEDLGTQTIAGGTSNAITGNINNPALNNTSNLFALVNFDGSLTGNETPISFSNLDTQIDDPGEVVVNNNLSNAVTRVDSGTCIPSANIDVKVTNSGLGCGNEVIYFVQVCNTGDAVADIDPATGIVDYPPTAFTFVDKTLVGTDPFVGATLPAGACADYEYTYTLNGNAVAGITYSLSVDVKEGPTSVPNICDPTNPTAVVEVQAGGHTWMDRNLGASRAATGSQDFEAYGNLFQWGRNRDGHECINWTSSGGSDGVEQNNESTSQSTSPNPGSTFIIGPNNWYNGTNPDDLWKPDLTGVNNPCPAGYRVPSETEFTNLGITHAVDAYSSIKLPMAGYRAYGTGSIFNAGFGGNYWSSTVSGTESRIFFFNSGIAYMDTFFRSDGYSVRCIKD